jgi:hypothetical protein
MFRIRFSLAIAVCLQFFAVTQLRADSTADAAAKSATPDPTGSWKWDYTFNDNKAEFRLKLDWDGKQLTGKYTAFGDTTDIDQAKLEKDDISFVAHREFNGNQFDVGFKGKVAADAIDGKVNVDFGQGPQDFDWHAKRFVDVNDVLGTWELKLETPNGLIEPKITITNDKDGLHGHYVSPFGEREAKNLELKDGQLAWEISGERDGNQFKVVYRGKPQGDTIEGTNNFDFNGNTGAIDFTGKRTPPEQKKAAAPKPTGEPAAPAAAVAKPADSK